MPLLIPTFTGYSENYNFIFYLPKYPFISQIDNGILFVNYNCYLDFDRYLGFLSSDLDLFISFDLDLFLSLDLDLFLSFLESECDFLWDLELSRADLELLCREFDL